MNARQLKSSILQLAVSGKLVPQNPAEEPAAALLERIRAEKERLIKSGKIKREKREAKIFRRGNSFYEIADGKERCIDDEIPFEIPESWEWVKISVVADLYTGNSINGTEKKLYFSNVVGMDYIGTKDVGFDQQITYNNGVNIPVKNFPKFKIAPKNTVLLCVEGGSAGRKIALTDRDVCFGNKLCCFNTHFNINKFLFYFLQTSFFLEQFMYFASPKCRKLQNAKCRFLQTAKCRFLQKTRMHKQFVCRHRSSIRYVCRQDVRMSETNRCLSELRIGLCRRYITTYSVSTYA